MDAARPSSASSASGTWAGTWRRGSSAPATPSSARSGPRHSQHLVERGLQWRDTPRAVAEAADVVFTSFPDDGVLEEVASGADGILAGLSDARSGST